MNFERTLSIKSDLIGEIAQDVRKTAFVVLQGVTLKTPKDKGEATSNWILGIGSPSAERRKPYVEGSKGSTAAQNITAAQQAGLAVIAQYPNNSLPDLWIVNNTPQIVPLNDGSSLQTPAKFVEQSISEAVNRTF